MNALNFTKLYTQLHPKIHSITKKATKEFSNCDKKLLVSRTKIGKQIIKIFDKLNDLFPNLAVTMGGIQKSVDSRLAWMQSVN